MAQIIVAPQHVESIRHDGHDSTPAGPPSLTVLALRPMTLAFRAAIQTALIVVAASSLVAGCSGSSQSPAPAPKAEQSPLLENVAGPTRAGDVHEPLMMRATAGMNMHTGFGAQGDHSESYVRIVFVSATEVRVDDAGKRREYVMDNSYGVKEDESTWSDEWTGSWSIQGDEMMLSLESSKRECDRLASDYGGPKLATPCDVIDPKATIECEATKLDGAEPVDAWMCSSKNTSMGGTSMSWVFGLDSCIERSGGTPHSGKTTYRHCDADPP